MELKLIRCPVHGILPMNPCYEYEYTYEQESDQSTGTRGKKNTRTALLRYVNCKSCGCGYYLRSSASEKEDFADIQCGSLTLKPGITKDEETLNIKKPKKTVVCPIHKKEVKAKRGTVQVGKQSLLADYHYCTLCKKGYSDQLIFRHFGSKLIDGMIPVEYSNTHLWKYDPEDISRYSVLNPQYERTTDVNADKESSGPVIPSDNTSTETEDSDSLKQSATHKPAGKQHTGKTNKASRRAVIDCPIHKTQGKVQTGKIVVGGQIIHAKYTYCNRCEKGYSDQLFFKHFGSKRLDNGVMVSYSSSVMLSGVKPENADLNSGNNGRKTGNTIQGKSVSVPPKVDTRKDEGKKAKSTSPQTEDMTKPDQHPTKNAVDTNSGRAFSGETVSVRREEPETVKPDTGDVSSVRVGKETVTPAGQSDGKMSLFQEEEKLKEDVYNTLFGMRKTAAEHVEWSQTQVNEGKYEDADSFVVYQQLEAAKGKKGKAEFLLKSLYDKPYFAHLCLKDINNDKDRTEYLLSDNPDLETVIPVNDEGFLIPFKQDEERPMYSAVFHAYQIQSDEAIPVKQYTYQLTKINDVEIRRRELLSVRGLYPAGREEDNGFRSNTDELLSQRLQENRHDSYFRNIISSIQAQQFDIIRTDVQTSFVVQGVPGSGKTQCIIHRLFFLRDTLKRDWDSVLFITPTQLFSKYTMPLMNRFHLTDVRKTTLVALYSSLLDEFDERFRFRQYRIEPTEEYLPDVYLREIYTDEWMEQVDQAIKEGIHSCFEPAYRLLNMEGWEDRPETGKEANELVSLLNEAAQEFDRKEQELEANQVLTVLRDHTLEIEKEIVRIEKQIADREQESALIREKLDQSKALEEEIRQHHIEQSRWEKEIQEKKRAALGRIQEAEKKIRRVSGGKSHFSALRDLQAAMNAYVAVDDPHFFIGRETALYAKMLEEEEEAIKEKERLLSNGSSITTWKKRTEEKLAQTKRTLRDLNDELLAKQTELEESRTKLEEQGINQDQNRKHRAELERTRYFLGRLESTVFETKIWNTLMPLKEKYGVPTIRTEDLEGGKRKETRLLFKSDLLFYLRLYRILHPEFVTHPYKIICVDEGQDLHAADYALLKEFYPTANWNVFGDLQQTIHEGCGIRDWKRDTGIENIYYLNTNYRNNAATVDFCNVQFGCGMKMFGKIKPEEKPVVVKEERELGKVLSPQCALIVKDQDAFSRFCFYAEMDPNSINFYDSCVDSTDEEKPSCFTIYAAKGLEFSEAAVYSYGMTRNQKLVACTRGMNKVYYLAGQ